MTRRQLIPCALIATLACAPLALAQQPAQQPSAAPAPAKPAKKTTAKPKPAAPSDKPAAAAPAAAGGAAPNLLGQYDNWGAYTAVSGGKKVCFALAKPSKSATNPPDRPRDQPYMFVSSRPAEKVKDEVSVLVGYGAKANAEASIDVGGATYAMSTQKDGAWLKNPADEPRLVDAMRKGSNAVVKGVSERGTASTDTYGLSGLAQALDRLSQECR